MPEKTQDELDIDVIQGASCGDRREEAIARLKGRWRQATLAAVRANLQGNQPWAGEEPGQGCSRSVEGQQGDPAAAVASWVWERLREKLLEAGLTSKKLADVHERTARACAEDWQDKEAILKFRKSFPDDEKGVVATFASLKARYHARAVSAARWLVHDDHLAEDAAQQAWLKVYLALKPGGRFRNERGTFRAYMLRAVHNEALKIVTAGRSPLEDLRVAQQWLERLEREANPGDQKRAAAVAAARRRVERAHRRVLKSAPEPAKEALPKRFETSSEEEALVSCLAELRERLQAEMAFLGLSDLFENLADPIPPTRNSNLREYVLGLIDDAEKAGEANPALTALRSDVNSGTTTQESEQVAARALVLRHRVSRLPDACVLHDWLERLLKAAFPKDKRLRESLWAYLVCTQAMLFGEETAPCALYRIQPNTYNAGDNSRFHVRTAVIRECVEKKGRQ